MDDLRPGDLIQHKCMQEPYLVVSTDNGVFAVRAQEIRQLDDWTIARKAPRLDEELDRVFAVSEEEIKQAAALFNAALFNVEPGGTA